MKESDCIKQLMKNLHDAFGLDFSEYRDKCLMRRVDTRLRITKNQTYYEYLQYLDVNPDEYKKLLNALTINVTSFFRDQNAWISIEELVVKDLVRRKKSGIKAWSAGCADGAEAYSLAILFSEVFAEKSSLEKTVSIIGTDIDDNSIARAKAGVYTYNIHLNKLGKPTIDKYFNKDEQDRYLVKNELKKVTEFKHNDLVLDAMPKHFDLILCRNVMIYFERGLQEKIMKKFCNSLNKGGYLVLGKVETIGDAVKNMFEEIDRHNKIFRKK